MHILKTEFARLWQILEKSSHKKHVEKLQSLSFPYTEDYFTFDKLLKLYESHKTSRESIAEMNKNVPKDHKKIRNTNFPSEISENMVKFALRQWKIYSYWHIKGADLQLENNYKLEVKCFTSTGPCSFGPTQPWNNIIFVDMTDIKNDYVEMHLVKLSNASAIWKNIKISKKSTFDMVCKAKVRPRLAFKKIIAQIPDKHIMILYAGSVYNLNSKQMHQVTF